MLAAQADYVVMIVAYVLAPDRWQAINNHHMNSIVTILSYESYITKSILHYNHKTNYINGLEQDCSNYSANALELLQSCTKPSIVFSGGMQPISSFDIQG